MLVDQLSRAGCWKGDTWGYDRRGIWVANGCRAVFRVGGYGSDWANSMHHNGSYSSSPDWRNDQEVDRWRDDESHKMTNDQKVGAAVGAAVVIAALAAAAKHEDDHHDNHSGHRGRDSRHLRVERARIHTYCSLGFGEARRAQRASSAAPRASTTAPGATTATASGSAAAAAPSSGSTDRGAPASTPGRTGAAARTGKGPPPMPGWLR